MAEPERIIIDHDPADDHKVPNLLHHDSDDDDLTPGLTDDEAAELEAASDDPGEVVALAFITDMRPQGDS